MSERKESIEHEEDFIQSIQPKVLDEIGEYSRSQQNETAGLVVETEDGEQIFVRIEEGFVQNSQGVHATVHPVEIMEMRMKSVLIATNGKPFRVIAEFHSHTVSGGAVPSNQDVKTLKLWDGFWNSMKEQGSPNILASQTEVRGLICAWNYSLHSIFKKRTLEKKTKFVAFDKIGNTISRSPKEDVSKRTELAEAVKHNIRSKLIPLLKSVLRLQES